jgi:hypothetical protein
MKDVVATALLLLNTGFVLLLCGFFIRHEWKKQGRLDLSAWLCLAVFGGPAAIVFVATLMGFK